MNLTEPGECTESGLLAQRRRQVFSAGGGGGGFFSSVLLEFGSILGCFVLLF